MKTTIELPDDLVIEAKKRAAELRRPLRALVEAGLREHLRALEGGASVRPRQIEWITVDGGLPAGLDLSDRGAMREWILREGGR